MNMYISACIASGGFRNYRRAEPGSLGDGSRGRAFCISWMDWPPFEWFKTVSTLSIFSLFYPRPPPKTRHCVLLWVQYYFNEADKRNTIEVAACSVCPLLHSRAQYTAECRRRVSISIQRQMKHDHIFQLTKSSSTLQAPPPAPLTRWTRLRLVSAPAAV